MNLWEDSHCAWKCLWIISVYIYIWNTNLVVWFFIRILHLLRNIYYILIGNSTAFMAASIGTTQVKGSHVHHDQKKFRRSLAWISILLYHSMTKNRKKKIYPHTSQATFFVQHSITASNTWILPSFRSKKLILSWWFVLTIPPTSILGKSV